MVTRRVAIFFGFFGRILAEAPGAVCLVCIGVS